MRPGIVLDFGAAGRVVEIEILDASRHVAEGADFAHLVAAWSRLPYRSHALSGHR